MAQWNSEEIDFLLRHLSLTTRAIHSRFKLEFGDERTYDSIQKQARKLRDIGVKEDSDLSLVETAEDLLDPSVMKAQTILWLHTMANLTRGQKIVHKPGVQSNKESLVIQISDVHWGKKVLSGDNKDTCSFDMAIASERVLSITERLQEEISRRNIDEIVLTLAGDINEGENIYAGQNIVLEAPVIIQSKEAILTIYQLALNLIETFGVPVRIETVPGNHGRSGKEGDKQSNWDNVIYQSLAFMSSVSDNNLLVVNPFFHQFNIVDIKGLRCGLNHRGTKHLGTPAMQIRFAGWVISKDIDLLIHGHWHTWEIASFLGRPVLGNGSICGEDDLSESMAKGEPPRQGYFFIQEGKPVNSFSFIQW